MVLTLHNVIKMKSGRLPFHGALLSIQLKGGKTANVLLMGDTGAGKSESIEALRGMADAEIRDLSIIADDMGSLELREDGVIAYGTEIGAFLRLDDLSPGFAFGQIDRAIIMSASASPMASSWTSSCTRTTTRKSTKTTPFLKSSPT
jgi:energy-coupling factor transporter ATP-binding protein EcfA2